MKRTYRWQFHFNAMHNMTPEKDEGKHTHSFLVILCMEIEKMDLDDQNVCERALKQYLETYNGKYLNEMEVFQGKQPTIEEIGEVLYENIGKMAAMHGMHLVQVEVGDNPTTLFSIGNRLLLGSSYIPVSDENYEKYQQKVEV